MERAKLNPHLQTALGEHLGSESTEAKQERQLLIVPRTTRVRFQVDEQQHHQQPALQNHDHGKPESGPHPQGDDDRPKAAERAVLRSALKKQSILPKDGRGLAYRDSETAVEKETRLGRGKEPDGDEQERKKQKNERGKEEAEVRSRSPPPWQDGPEAQSRHRLRQTGHVPATLPPGFVRLGLPGPPPPPPAIRRPHRAPAA